MQKGSETTSTRDNPRHRSGTASQTQRAFFSESKTSGYDADADHDRRW
jgi:hypothetical protein